MDRKIPLKVAMATLGCKINQSDAASLASELTSQGHLLVSLRQCPDVFILHTCTVTAKTDYQCRQMIRRAIHQNPGAMIVVTGCYAQVSPESLQAIPGIDYIVGIGERDRIPGLLLQKSRQGEGQVLTSSLEKMGDWKEGKLPLSGERTRAYLKVQDGCNAFCSFCIVPYARGRSRSLPWQRAWAKAEELCRKGFKEIVLSGIHLGAYGEDLRPAPSLLSLLQKLEESPWEVRFRLSSIEPGEIAGPLIEFLGHSRKFCPHLHIPLQSGDDRTLDQMNRHYTGAFFEDLVSRLIQTIPDLAIGVDLIGGFPGEDEPAFGRTLDLLQRLPLAYFHVFPFSPRKGTRAADLPQQVPPQVIQGRCRRLRELGEEKRRAFTRSFLGKRVQVLVESRRDRESGLLRGYSRNYLSILLSEGEELINREVEVELTEIRGGKAFGRI